MTRAFLLDGLQAGLSPLWGGGRVFSLESVILGSATHQPVTLCIASSVTHFGISCSLQCSTFFKVLIFLIQMIFHRPLLMFFSG